MYLVRLMWRSASESKPVHSRYSRLSQAWRTAESIRIMSAVSNWLRRRTSHELNSLNSIRFMWSTASEPLLSIQRASYCVDCRIQDTNRSPPNLHAGNFLHGISSSQNNWVIKRSTEAKYIQANKREDLNIVYLRN